MRIYGQRHHGCRVEEYLWRQHRLVTLDNELLRVGVLASKGADIAEFRYKPRDLDVLWHAPQPLLPREYVPSVARPQGAFLDYYTGGWQEIFPSAGPGTVLEGAALGQHGEVALLPWDVAVEEDTAGRIAVCFTVETMRTPFRLRRRMILSHQSPVLRIEEEVTNLGRQSLAFGWGHHPVLAPPFLEPGCTIEMPGCDLEVPEAAAGLQSRFPPRSRGRFPHLRDVQGATQRMDLVPASESRADDVVVGTNLSGNWCAVRNPARELAVGLVWDAAVLPYLWMWQVYNGGAGYPFFGRAFCLGIEPFNCPMAPLAESAAHGRAPVLDPGATSRLQLEFGVYEAPAAVAALDYGGKMRFGG